MAPLVLLLVLNSEVVAHDDKISVLISVLESATKDVSEDVEAWSAFALSVVKDKRCSTVKELEEVHSLDDSADDEILLLLVAVVVSHVGSGDDSFDQKAVRVAHSSRQLAYKLLSCACESCGSINLGKTPHAKVLECSDTVCDGIV